MKHSIVKLCALALLALLLAACSAAPATPPPTNAPEPPEGPAPAVSIKGNISEVNPGSGAILGTILVEGEKIEGNQYGRASLRITQQTQILEQKGDELAPVDFSAFEFGQLVEAKMTGPIAESYPVQAEASEVIILARMPKN